MSAHLISEEQLLELVDSIWTDILGLSVSAGSGDGGGVPESRKVTTCISISGAFSGMVLFLPTEEFARQAAARMFAAPATLLDEADIEDAVCELCNMLGGGVKSLLPGPSVLSLPSIMHGVQYSVRVPMAELAAQMQFSCEGESLELRLLQSRAAAV